MYCLCVSLGVVDCLIVFVLWCKTNEQCSPMEYSDVVVHHYLSTEKAGRSISTQTGLLEKWKEGRDTDTVSHPFWRFGRYILRGSQKNNCRTIIRTIIESPTFGSCEKERKKHSLSLSTRVVELSLSSRVRTEARFLEKLSQYSSIHMTDSRFISLYFFLAFQRRYEISKTRALE